MNYHKKYMDFNGFKSKMGDNLYRMNYNLSSKNSILTNFEMLIIK